MPSALKYVPSQDPSFRKRVEIMANWLGDLLDSDQGKEPTAPPTEHDEDPLRNWLNVGPREPLHITQWRRLWLFEGIMTLAGCGFGMM